MAAARTLAGIAAAAAVLAGAAGAAEPPRTPAGTQLAWVVAELNGSAPPSPAQVAEHFSDAFLKAVPAEKLVAALAPISADRPIRLVQILGGGERQLLARVETRTGAAYKVSIAVAAAAPHRIEGLLFEPVAAQAATWQAVDSRLRRLAGHVGLYAARAGGPAVHAVAAYEPAPIGSAFKLYVLGALDRAVAAGKASWDEQLAIHDAWKSLPSGDMRNEPAGRRFTLRRYAEQMISVSDNTAADHLIHRLGRGAVEAELRPLGNDVPARNEPFLTTRELFALKLGPAPLRGEFARASTAERRRLLGRVDALRPMLAQARDWTKPRAVESVEWFASPASLGRAIARLASRKTPRAILAINAGVPIDRSVWRYAGFKGGSEPGVLSLTWYLERKDGTPFVLSLVLADEQHAIDAAAAVSTAEAAIRLLAAA